VNSPLLIVGASVRAAAESAQRAGFQPFAIDLFNDSDLSRIAECRLSQDYPQDVPELAKEFPSMPFVYTGALENYPETIARLSETHRLLGNSPATVQQLRDPFRLQELLVSASFPTIDQRTRDDSPTDPENWLIKPIESGHGMGIRPAKNRSAGVGEYFQRRLEGVSVGALFLANGEECRCVGIHQQLVVSSPVLSQPFLFSGAYAPYELADTTTRMIHRIGQFLTRQTGLTGLFGVDFMIVDDVPVLLEVNPRYTSTVELWERLLGRSLLADHVAACETGFLPASLECGPNMTAAKLIYYAPRTTEVSPEFENSLSDVQGARLGDLPHSGTRIEAGHPVCTLLVESETDAMCREIFSVALPQISFLLGDDRENLEK